MPSEWWDLACEVVALEAIRAHKRQHGAAVRDVSKRTGNNTNMLRRMRACKAFLESRFDASTVEVLRGLPMSHIDVLSRAEAIDGVEACRQAKEVARDPDSYTYRRLLDWFEGLKARAYARSEATDLPHKSTVMRFKATCITAARGRRLDPVYAKLPFVPAPTGFRTWKGGHPLFSPTFAGWVEVPSDRRHGRSYEVDGFECFLSYEHDAATVPRDRVLKTVGIASLVRCMWMMVERSQSGRYEDLVAAFGASNVGVLRVDTISGDVELGLAPSGPPVPDRRALLDVIDVRLPQERMKRKARHV